MGPRFLGRGNGHGFVVDDIMLQPSMGPRFLGRGNVVLPLDVADAGEPSMGPRFLGRGNLIRLASGNWVQGLQWGRAF